MKHGDAAGSIIWIVAVVVGLGGAGGCATKGFVRENMREMRDEMSRVEKRLGDRSDQIATLAGEAKSSADLALAGVADARDLALGNTEFKETARYRVSFAWNSAKFDESSRAALDAAAEEIAGNPQFVVNVLGFADPSGSEEYNLALGRRRADAVVRYLLDRRPADLGRFQSISFGETPPSIEAFDLGDGAARRQVLVVLLERTPLEQNDHLTVR